LLSLEHEINAVLIITTAAIVKTVLAQLAKNTFFVIILLIID